MSNEVNRKIALISILILAVVTVAISIVVYFHPVMNFEVLISKDLQAKGDTLWQQQLISNILSFVSLIGRTTIMVWIVLAFALLFWLLKYYWENLFCLITLFSAVINSLIKILIHRPRPSEDLVNVLDRQLSPSYPSGHVVFFTVFFGYIIATMFFTKKIPLFVRIIIGIFSLLLIFLVSISRIYLGAHWVTDVIAGYCEGFILLAILLYFYLKKYASSK